MSTIVSPLLSVLRFTLAKPDDALPTSSLNIFEPSVLAMTLWSLAISSKPVIHYSICLYLDTLCTEATFVLVSTESVNKFTLFIPFLRMILIYHLSWSETKAIHFHTYLINNCHFISTPHLYTIWISTLIAHIIELLTNTVELSTHATHHHTHIHTNICTRRLTSHTLTYVILYKKRSIFNLVRPISTLSRSFVLFRRILSCFRPLELRVLQ